ncbi:MAG: molybdopterin biosynthesis protein [Defluviitaleaceae bacterium]|nr:molybdopterin biosynthesis protein [Defluviitaleaceae bacterium]
MPKRNLYLTNTPIDEALGSFWMHFNEKPVHSTETIHVAESLGRTTAEAVFARNNSPLYDCAAMDGIAVVSGKTASASENNPLTLTGDEFLVVDTGDPVQPPFDAVIMAEELEETAEGMIIRQSAAPWQHLRPIGEDIVQGEMVLPSLHKIRPMDIGVLLSGGITQVLVKSQPSVAIIPTGTELVEAHQTPKIGDIIESNSYMLGALVAQDGGKPARFGIVADDYNTIKESLLQAAENHDIILICSGTSAGREDFAVHVLNEIGQVIVHGVAMKPGKPVILAIVAGKPVIGVPGYPVSAFIAYENFVKPILLGEKPSSGVIQATLTRRLVSSFKHQEYVRVKVGRIGEKLVATPLARGAGAAMSLVRADGFCVIPRDYEGLDAGAVVEVVLCREIADLERTVVAIGSHDMMLDIMSDMLSGANLSSSHVGSMGGLMALKNGEAHIAPIHQLDEATGEYNIPIIKKLFGGRKMALIKGVGRVQGVMTAVGNPLNIQGLADLTKHRFINRQRGAGTRILLDYKLAQEGVDPESISGYDREAATHMAVAAAIAGGSADCGLGIQAAANAMGLDFIPIDTEEYDFAIPQEFLTLDHIQIFINTLKSPDLHGKLAELGGYDTSRCGEVILIDC